MREINFRAWHKYGGGMMVVDSLYFNNDLVGVVDKSHETRVMGYSFADVEIMQYTGLKDKNGKDIYEGDILKADSGEYYSNSYFTTEDEWEMVMQVKFKYSSFVMVCTEDEEIEIHLGETGWNEIELEVIGNIYENPELLEKEQSK